MNKKETFYVDIPTVECIGNPDGAYRNVAIFGNETAAIEFCMEHFGADEHGCVSLISPSVAKHPLLRPTEERQRHRDVEPT